MNSWGVRPFSVFEPTAEIVGVDEVLKVPTQLFVTVVMEMLDGCVLDGSVHALDLSVGPRMIDLGEPVLDTVLVTDPIEDVVEGVFVTVTSASGAASSAGAHRGSRRATTGHACERRHDRLLFKR